ncbi:MAG: TolC family protein [Candidatus Omnitrophica bacterium]|nr:TolC family protein [Candidatus Omnitrophota bacterium]
MKKSFKFSRKIIVLYASFWSIACWPGDLDSLTLSKAVNHALRFNYELQAVHYDFEAAKNEKRESSSSFWPQLSINSDFNNLESNRFTPSQEAAGFSGKTYSNKFQLSQLLFDRSIAGEIRLAGLRQKAAEWQEIGQGQTVVFNTIVSFLDVLKADELVRVQKQRLDLANHQLKTAQHNFEVGYQISADVARAQLECSSAQRDLVSAQVDFERSQVSLNRLLGAPVTQRYAMVDPYFSVYHPPEKRVFTQDAADRLFNIAGAHNASVQVSRLLVQQYEESVKSAKGEFLPTISAGASWGYYDTGNPDFETDEWSVQASIQIPVFDGGRKNAKIKKTQNKLYAQQKRYDDVIHEVHGLVEDSLLLIHEEALNLKTSIESEKVAQKNHEVYMNLYEEGMAQSLDVTEALTQLVEAKTDVVTARFNYLRIVSQLLFVLGVIPTEGNVFEQADWLNVVK